MENQAIGNPRLVGILCKGVRKVQLYYPRATRCGGDCITLLWFRPCVCPSRFDLVNTIETKPLCTYSSNLADIFSMTREWSLLIFGRQKSKVKVTIDVYGNEIVNMIKNLTVVCFFIKLGMHFSHSDKMGPIDFGGQRSKVKVTIHIYGNKILNMIENKPLCVSPSIRNLIDILAIVRGCTLLILEVSDQRSRSQLTCMEISLWTR